MKKLAIIAFAAMSTIAFAADSDRNGNHNGGGNQSCAVCETNDINVGAPQIQIAVAKGGSTVANASGTDTRAGNNMSTNTYGVDLRAKSVQITALKNTTVNADASGTSTVAQNNMASNIGSVAVNAPQLQVVAKSGEYVSAVASGTRTKAINNFATNNACLTCQ